LSVLICKPREFQGHRLTTAESSFISASHAERSPRPELISMSNTGIRDMKTALISV
jgi:hypothetical protein